MRTSAVSCDVGQGCFPSVTSATAAVRPRPAAAPRPGPRGPAPPSTSFPPTRWLPPPPRIPGRAGQAGGTRGCCRPRGRCRTAARPARPPLAAPVPGRRPRRVPRAVGGTRLPVVGDGRQQAVPAGGPLKRRLAGPPGDPPAHHPDRRPGPLHRRLRYQDIGRPGAVVPAVVAERLAAHQPVVDREALVQFLRADRAALVGLERGPPLVHGAKSHGHHRPAAAEPVDGADGRREVPRPPPGSRREQGAEPDPLRRHRGGAEGDPRLLAPDRLPGEHAVPAAGFAERGQLSELTSGRVRHHEPESHEATVDAVTDIRRGPGHCAVVPAVNRWPCPGWCVSLRLWPVTRRGGRPTLGPAVGA
jgi:hypothetical protein